MPLISLGYSQSEFDRAYQRGYAEALRSILDEVQRRLPGESGPPALPVTAHTLATQIISRVTEAQTAQAEVAWLRRWEADLRADPLWAQLQRVRQELKDEQAQCADLTRDLMQAQKQLRDERTAHLADVQAKDTRLMELSDLVARLTLQRLEPVTEVAATAKVDDNH